MGIDTNSSSTMLSASSSFVVIVLDYVLHLGSSLLQVLHQVEHVLSWDNFLQVSICVAFERLDQWADVENSCKDVGDEAAYRNGHEDQYQNHYEKEKAEWGSVTMAEAVVDWVHAYSVMPSEVEFSSVA